MSNLYPRAKRGPESTLSTSGIPAQRGAGTASIDSPSDTTSHTASEDQVTVTVFSDHTARVKREVSSSWKLLFDAVLTKSAPSKGKLPWIKLARFGNNKTDKGSLRHDANVLAITGIEADYDGGEISVDEAVQALEKNQIKAMVYTSPSHTPERPRWRVLCPLSAERLPSQREHLVARLNGALDGVLAPESFTLSQSYYFGSVQQNPAHHAVLVDGTPIDLLTALDAFAIGRLPNPDAQRADSEDKSGTATWLSEISSGTSYHGPVLRFAGQQAARGVPLAVTQKVLEEAFDAVPDDKRDARWRQRRGDLARCVANIYEKEGIQPGDEDSDKQARGQSKKDSETSAHDRVIDAVLGAGVKFWRDVDGKVYARAEIDGAVTNLPVRGPRFEMLCRKLYGETYPTIGKHGKRPGAVRDAALTTAIGGFEALGLSSGEVCTPGVRLADHEGAIWIDLGDESYRAIRVTADGWSVERRTSAPLVRTDGMRALPVPVREDGSSERLRSLLNVQSDEDFYLTCAWLVAALRPTGPYPIIAVDGEQGSGKSTACRILRRLVDPNAADLRAMARGEDNLLIAAVNSRVIGIDNVSFIEADMADALCRVATGAGFSKRTLYSNQAETIVSVCRPILLNGIPATTATRGDLADRSIALTLPTIPEDKRRTEVEVWAEFEAAAPGIFALLLDGLVMALKRLPTVKLDQLPRMADFAKVACAAAPAFGWTEADMIAAMKNNRHKGTESVVEGDPIASAIRQIASESKNGWSGTATELLEEIESLTPDAVTRERGWPKDTARLSTRVTRAAPALRQVGVSVELTRQGGTGKKIWKIKEME